MRSTLAANETASIPAGGGVLGTRFASVEARLSDFKTRLADEIARRLHAEQKRAPYMFEDTVTIDVENLDAGKLGDLFLGRKFAVLDEYVDHDWDGNDDRDRESIKETMTKILSEWQDEVEALCEEMDTDQDTLTESWLDLSEEDFAPGTLDLNLHFNDYQIGGQVAAVAELPFLISLDPTRSDFIEQLRSLRISPMTFLDFARAQITDDAATSDGAIVDASLPALAKWGFSVNDLVDDSEKSLSAVDLYAERFRSAVEIFQRETQLSPATTIAQSAQALTPAQLHAYVSQHSYGNDCSINAYLHLKLGSDTVDGFSTDVSCHDLDPDLLVIEVQSGYLAPDVYPGRSDETLELAASVDIQLSTLKVTKESPELGDCDTIQLRERLQLSADLHRIFHSVKSESTQGVAMQNSIPPTTTKLLARLSQASAWAVHAALGDHPLIASAIVPHLALTETLLDQDDLDRQLLHQVEIAGLRPTKYSNADIDSLLSQGARSSLLNAAGGNAFTLAAQRNWPLSRLDELWTASTAECIAMTGGRAFELALKTKALGNRAVDAADSQVEIEYMTWFLQRELEMPANALKSHAGRLAQGSAHLLALENGHFAANVIRASFQEESDQQDLLDHLVYEAALGLRVEMLGGLLEAGGQLDAHARQKSGVTLDECVSQAHAKVAEHARPKVAKCLDLIMASRARSAALSAIDILSLASRAHSL